MWQVATLLDRAELEDIAACVLSHFSHVDCSCQAPLSKAFSRQEYWSGLPRPPPGDLPDPGIEPLSPTT